MKISFSELQSGGHIANFQRKTLPMDQDSKPDLKLYSLMVYRLQFPDKPLR